MIPIGLLIDTQARHLKPTNLGMITAARAAGHQLTALLMEPLPTEQQDQLAQYGVHQVVNITLTPPDWHPERWAQAVAETLQARGIQTLLGLVSARGRDLLPRIAAILDAPLVMDCVGVDIPGQKARTYQYSGKTLATVQLYGEKAIYGLRPRAVAPYPAPVTAEVVTHVVEIPEDSGLTVLEEIPGEPGAHNLTEADLIIAGGRGMQNSHNFTLLHDCARALGNAAVGASRVAVDEGWVPYAMQVGQTGAKVTPKVYLACGISGSVQHFAGMKTAGMIIALNTDPDAAIMANSDYIIVADLFTVLPELIRQLDECHGDFESK